jgi:hypothetical protein
VRAEASEESSLLRVCVCFAGLPGRILSISHSNGMHMLSTLQISREIDRKVARTQQEFPVFAVSKAMPDLWR